MYRYNQYSSFVFFAFFFPLGNFLNQMCAKKDRQIENENGERNKTDFFRSNDPNIKKERIYREKQGEKRHENELFSTPMPFPSLKCWTHRTPVFFYPPELSCRGSVRFRAAMSAEALHRSGTSSYVVLEVSIQRPGMNLSERLALSIFSIKHIHISIQGVPVRCSRPSSFERLMLRITSECCTSLHDCVVTSVN